MAEIRQVLAQCFKELMQEKSFQKIIVKDITDRANVKRPTFYTSVSYTHLTLPTNSRV